MLRSGLLVDVGSIPDDAVVVDTRLALTGPPGRERFDAGHLPGAAYVDLEVDLAEPPGAGGRHPLPSPARFGAAMRRAGVSRTSTVVVYDDGPATAAARLWWLLRDHGHSDVMVLDGGLAAWRDSGRPLSTSPVAPARGDFAGSPGHLPVVEADDIPRLVDSGLLLDVRSAARFRGEQEPIDPVAGHVPGAVNAPLAEVTGPDQRFRPPEVLRAHFTALGVRDGMAFGAYCGSGVTACQTLLALRLAGFDDAALYPGSWSGWITEPGRPVATGA